MTLYIIVKQKMENDINAPQTELEFTKPTQNNIEGYKEKTDTV
jgi:hypothetical protein